MKQCGERKVALCLKSLLKTSTAKGPCRENLVGPQTPQISWMAANGAAAPELRARTTKDSHLAVETVGVWERGLTEGSRR